jgi:hypothetical protein
MIFHAPHGLEADTSVQRFSTLATTVVHISFLHLLSLHGMFLDPVCGGALQVWSVDTKLSTLSSTKFCRSLNMCSMSIIIVVCFTQTPNTLHKCCKSKSQSLDNWPNSITCYNYLHNGVDFKIYKLISIILITISIKCHFHITKWTLASPFLAISLPIQSLVDLLILIHEILPLNPPPPNLVT